MCSKASGTACLLLFFGFVELAYADPAVLIENAKLAPADGAPEGGFGVDAAIWGDVAVVGATTGNTIFEGVAPGAAYVFERDRHGIWQQSAKLVPSRRTNDNFGMSVAVEGRTIVVGALGQGVAYVFEDAGAGWVETAILGPFPGAGHSVAIDNGVIMVNIEEPNGAALFQRSAGGWIEINRLANGFAPPGTDFDGPAVDVSRTTAIHGSVDLAEDPPAGEVFIYSADANDSWLSPSVTRVGRPSPEGDGFGHTVAISNDVAAIGGAYIFERDAAGTWRLVTRVPDGSLGVDRDTVVAGTVSGFSALAYRKSGAGAWNHVATLGASDGKELGFAPSRAVGFGLDVRKRRVIAGPYIFDLPKKLSRPALLQDDFEDGDASDWLPLQAGTFSVVSSGSSLVLRQSGLTGGAAAVLQGSDRKDQSVQADVTARSFASGSNERWFGLAVRFTDINNHYYVTVRNTNVIQLKRTVNGAFRTLASAALPVELNRNYRLRLEAIGTRLRVYVDGHMLLEARDDSHARGQVAVRMFKTRADYDNIVVSSNPTITLLADDFEQFTLLRRWAIFTSTGEWPRGFDPSGVFTQSSTEVLARIAAETSAEQQVVEAKARSLGFEPGGERWFGLMTRFIDEGNYHYVTVRNNNTVSLRRLRDGEDTVLDTAPMTVTAGTWYTLRLEAIDRSLRAYVNGQLMVEAVDVSAAPVLSTFGLVTFKTAAEYDEVLAQHP